MLRMTWRALVARKVRLALSAFAIVLGVAFVAGSFIFTDAMGDAFDGIIEGSTSDVANCIRWVHDQGAKVISMSLGGGASTTLQPVAVVTPAPAREAASEPRAQKPVWDEDSPLPLEPLIVLFEASRLSLR